MVPNFALALSFEGIGLLRRVGSSWARIDDVPIDHPDLDVAVIALRDRAEELDPKGAEVAILLPNEQIRYVDIPDLGGDDTARDAAIRSALDGATPYALDDLNWDHVQSGGRLQIAAVAQETLDEAETFARDHGFTPVCHMARAPDGSFDGTVFFGTAKGWKRAVDRPGRAIHIVSPNAAALQPVAAIEPAPLATPEEEKPQSAPVAPDKPAEPHAPDIVDEMPPVVSVAHETPGIVPETPEVPVDVPAYNVTQPAQLDLGPQPAPANSQPSGQDAAEQTALPPVSFSSTRAARDDDRLPPAPRPNLTPPTGERPTAATPPAVKSRFTPVSAREVVAPGAGITADHIEDFPAPMLKPAAVPLRRPAPESKLPPARKPAPAASAAAAPPVTKPVPSVDSPSPVETAKLAATPLPTPSVPVTDSPSTETHSAPKLGAAKRENPGQTTPVKTETLDKPVGKTRKKALGATLASLGRKAATAKTAKAKDTPRVGTPEMVPDAPAGAQPMLANREGDPAQSAVAPSSSPTPAASDGPVTKAAPARNPLSRLAALRKPQEQLPRGIKTAPKAPQTKSQSGKPSPAFSLATTPPPLAKPDVSDGLRAEKAPLTKGKTTPASKTKDAAPAVARGGAAAAASAPAVKPVDTPADTPQPSPLRKPSRKSMTSKEERDRLTVFGARNRPQPVGGKPRFLGLLLTAGLLAFLVIVAAWASVFRDDGIAGLFGGTDEPTEAIANLPEVESLPASDAEQTVTLLPEADTPASPEEADAPVELAALDTETPAPVEPRAVPVVPTTNSALTPEEAVTTYAATGIWQRAPAEPLTPEADVADNVYVASIDPGVQVFDAVALPRANEIFAEPVVADPGLPPPAGMTFDIDERGVVRATPEGALSPDGLRIFTGLPPVVPPLRNPTPVALPVPAVVAPAPDTVPGDDPQPAPPAATPVNPLSQFRPEARPDDVVEQQERAVLRGISRDELAGFRPRLRPLTAQEQAVEDEPEAPATAQAVRDSLSPVGRPRNINAIVQRAERQRPTEPVQTAAVAPQTVQPSLPSSASVAASATVRNAINLNRINLIGVYGTPSNRRALVRLASGKYLKVKVGDRLDGGRVAAISEAELRYTKGGRNLTLKMPRG